MDDIIKQTPWADLIIKPTDGKIIIQQKWNYSWPHSSSQSPWTESEKNAFHLAAEEQIQSVWSNNAVVSVSGNSSFAKKYKTKDFTLLVDIRRVVAEEHWRVHVTKVSNSIAPNAGSVVHWGKRYIKLNSRSITPIKRRYGPYPVKQKIVAHEFGHTVYHLIYRGNIGRTDEYLNNHRHIADRASIMNMGSQLRNRHYRNVIDTLSDMIPDTTFSLKNVRTHNVLTPA